MFLTTNFVRLLALQQQDVQGVSDVTSGPVLQHHAKPLVRTVQHLTQLRTEKECLAFRLI